MQRGGIASESPNTSWPVLQHDLKKKTLTLPVVIGSVTSQSTKPGDTSSSSIPLSLTLTFSPGPMDVTSISSDHS